MVIFRPDPEEKSQSSPMQDWQKTPGELAELIVEERRAILLKTALKWNLGNVRHPNPDHPFDMIPGSSCNPLPHVCEPLKRCLGTLLVLKKLLYNTHLVPIPLSSPDNESIWRGAGPLYTSDLLITWPENPLQPLCQR